MSTWFSVRQVATQRRVSPSKVYAWIRSGDLEAINMARTRLVRPLWRISADALSAFDRVRSNRASIARRARRGRALPRGVIEFFK